MVPYELVDKSTTFPEALSEAISEGLSCLQESIMEKDHLAIILESIDNKFQLVLEGHASLANQIKDTRQELVERIDLVDFKVEVVNQKIDAVDAKLSKKIDEVDAKLSKRIDEVDAKLSKKIDAVSADLKAHRADTEAHGGMYLVKES